jgi:hypothetical protein
MNKNLHHQYWSVQLRCSPNRIKMPEVFIGKQFKSNNREGIRHKALEHGQKAGPKLRAFYQVIAAKFIE